MNSHLMLDHLLCLVSATRFCDRQFGGINYPVGGVGEIAKTLAKGLINHGSNIIYRANATNIVIENGQAVGVKLSDGRELYAKTIFQMPLDGIHLLLKKEVLPKEEEQFQKAYVKAPYFLSIHLGVKVEVLPSNTDCHHFVLKDVWKYMENPYGSLFLSIPTVLDSSLAPQESTSFTFLQLLPLDWEGLSRKDYETKKELVAEKILSRLEKKLFPGLQSSIVSRRWGSQRHIGGTWLEIVVPVAPCLAVPQKAY